MSDKKYQIFVSSTYRDLKETRSKVIDTILNLYHFPVGMEFFSAGDAEQWEIIRELIDVSDYYLVVIGHRYGSSAGDGISYTEKEYDYAVEKGIPVLAFIRDRSVATVNSERDEKVADKKKLEKFIKKATSSKMCSFWTTDEDLTTQVAIALPKIFHRTPRIGWVRGDSAVTPEVANELAASGAENRVLRDELAALRRTMVSKEPKLELSIDVEWNFTLGEYVDIEMPKQLDISDIPSHLADEVDEFDVQDYNSKIPTPEELEGFNSTRRFYLAAKNDAYLPIFQLTNNGTAKARDIHVTIEFPDILIVMSKYDHEMDGEGTDKLVTNPIEDAEAEYQKRKKGKELTISDLSIAMFAQSIAPTVPSISDMRPKDSHVVDNNVVINLDSLIHTYSKTIDEGVRVFPIAKGDAEVVVTIICEELTEPVVIKMPVKVT